MLPQTIAANSPIQNASTSQSAIAGGAEDAPEEKQLRRVAEKSRRQPKIKRAADSGLVGQPDETKGIAENQQAGGGKWMEV